MIGFSNTGDTALRAWFCCAAIGTGLLCGAALGAEPVPQPPASAGALSLTVDEATALFLKQNLDLLIAQYGIESARGLEVTARLFPNPILSLDASTSTTRPVDRTGSLSARVDQL
ncbi:MAG: hypothetical protein E6K67_08325, partial [Nitrospirae bacterium]